MIELVVVRIVFIAVLSTCAYFLKPFQSDGHIAALGGLAFGGAIILFERRVKQVSLKRLIGGAIGSVMGIFGAFLMSLVIGHAAPDGSTTIHFIQICILLWMTYIGLVVGAFVGIAAFFGALMNFNFILAGAASTNGLLLLAALVIVLAWKVAGYIGADYFLSKRTDVYVDGVYQHASGTDSVGKAVAQINGLSASTTSNQVAAIVGIRHKF